MRCLLCNKSLYEQINFHNIFKLNYVVHTACMKYHELENKWITFPLRDKVINMYAVFKYYDDKMNEEALFKHYGKILYQYVFTNKITDFIFFDERDKQKISTIDLELILPMFGEEVYFLTLFQNNVIGM